MWFHHCHNCDRIKARMKTQKAPSDLLFFSVTFQQSKLWKNYYGQSSSWSSSVLTLLNTMIHDSEEESKDRLKIWTHNKIYWNIWTHFLYNWWYSPHLATNTTVNNKYNSLLGHGTQHSLVLSILLVISTKCQVEEYILQVGGVFCQLRFPSIGNQIKSSSGDSLCTHQNRSLEKFDMVFSLLESYSEKKNISVTITNSLIV